MVGIGVGALQSDFESEVGVSRDELVRHNPSPSPSESSSKFETRAITSASGEAGKAVVT